MYLAKYTICLPANISAERLQIPIEKNLQSLEYTQVKYISQKYTLEIYTLEKYTFGKYTFGKYTFRKYTFQFQEMLLIPKIEK